MFKYNKIITIILILLLYLILTGCTPLVKDVPLSNSIEDTSYPLIIRDDSGAENIILEEPKRIISLQPSSTEILWALGQEDKLIAVTKWDNYPAGIQEKGYYLFQDALNPDIDQIQKLQPDLVIIGSLSGETLRKLRNLELPVVSYNPQSIEKTYEAIRNIGYITNSARQASRVIMGMQEKENNIKQIIDGIEEEDKPRVWLEVSSNLFTPGQNTFLNELITKAGGNNIASDLEGWGQYNSDQVIVKDPQIIFFTYGQFEKNAEQLIKSRPGWQNIQAVRNNKITELDNDLVTRTGPRIIDSLELIARVLYPDKF